MNPISLIRSLLICALMYLVSAAPSTSPEYNDITITTASTLPHDAGSTATPTNSTDNGNIDKTSNTISNADDSSSRALSDTDDTDISDNEAFYIGTILLANAVVFFGVIFYLLTPWMRVCSWFNNCRYNSGHGYYPAGLGYSLDDAARMLNGYNMPSFSYDRGFLAKRSLEYAAPILRTIAEAYDKYETLQKTKEE